MSKQPPAQYQDKLLLQGTYLGSSHSPFLERNHLIYLKGNDIASPHIELTPGEMEEAINLTQASDAPIDVPPNILARAALAAIVAEALPLINQDPLPDIAAFAALEGLMLDYLDLLSHHLNKP